MFDRTKVLVSAHRAGVDRNRNLENRITGLRTAAQGHSDFIEFDVQLTNDGYFVLHHDDTVSTPQGKKRISSMSYTEAAAYIPDMATLEDALSILAAHDKGAHVDLKFATKDGGAEVIVAKRSVETLGANKVIITSTEDSSVKHVRRWSRHHSPSLLVGLSLGKLLRGKERIRGLYIRLTELFPSGRLRRCDANLVVAHRLYARARIANLARSMGMPLLVWTVDNPKEIKRWLSDGRAWMVTTNYPSRVIAG